MLDLWLSNLDPTLVFQPNRIRHFLMGTITLPLFFLLASRPKTNKWLFLVVGFLVLVSGWIFEIIEGDYSFGDALELDIGAGWGIAIYWLITIQPRWDPTRIQTRCMVG